MSALTKEEQAKVVQGLRRLSALTGEVEPECHVLADKVEAYFKEGQFRGEELSYLEIACRTYAHEVLLGQLYKSVYLGLADKCEKLGRANV